MDIDSLKFDEKGLIPAIIQDINTQVVLMQAYMNRDSLLKTIESGKVCFFSRSRQRLWVKGEKSGHYLYLKEIRSDCDKDALLVKVAPAGPVYHTGKDTCWGETNRHSGFLFYLQEYLKIRKEESPEESYTARLISKGINKVAQKVGEEAVELVIEAKDDREDLFLNEAADLMYHYLVLLIAKGYGLEQVIDVLKGRHKTEK